MANKKYRLRYLPLFEQDLVQTVSYIANVLINPDAAEKLANDVETVYYVVIEDVMEVRRFLYGARDTDRYL